MFLGALAAPFVVLGPVQAQAPQTFRSPCATVRDHNHYARYVLRTSVGGHGGDFHGNTPTRRQLDKLGAMRACMKQLDSKKYRAMRGAWEKRAARNREYRYLDSITACGEWIACGIVEHESASSGYYRAYNPPATGCSGHGCIGAYQIDAAWFRGACSTVGDPWSPAAQHRCAYYLLTHGGMAHWGM